MITLADFQNYISHKLPLPQLSSHHLTQQEQQLLEWVAGLPAHMEAEQVPQLEKILNELIVADLDDEIRLKLLGVVTGAADRLITSLHRYYHYELGALSKEQLKYINQVSTLYTLAIEAYNSIIQHESLTLTYQYRPQPVQGWKQLLSLPKTPPLILAAAIYQSLLIYQKLWFEWDICYQKTSKHLWTALNHLYRTARQANITHIDLSAQVVAKQALSIHGLYVQLCLHSLLNVQAMQRPDILLVQRLLPLWSKQISATIEPQSETRLFVDLQSDNPPEYLTALSVINPYEDNHQCLFIDLATLTVYLRQRQQALLDSNNEAIEYQLVNKVLMTITYRYLERQTALPTQHSAKQNASIISGFDNIHYKVAGGHSLMSMIAAKELPSEQLPRYDTQPKKGATDTKLNVETFDSTDRLSRFRTLHLLPSQNLSHPQKEANQKESDKKDSDKQVTERLLAESSLNQTGSQGSQAYNELDIRLSENLIKGHTAPPPLHLMSLFLLCRHNDSEPKWSLGMVRWLKFNNKYTEVEWEVLGHVLTACALRVDNRDQHSQYFLPALMVAGDEALKTEFTLIVPPYHFRSNDKVMLRINHDQKRLRLQQCLINTKAFSQYKVMQL